MAKYKLKLNLKRCQGQFVCTAGDPDHFGKKEGEEKATLIGGEREGNIETLEIEENALEEAKVATNGCAFQAIELIDEESGELIAPEEG